MARRKKGRDISGWVLIDKPAGVTSTSVVNKLRWAFDAKKAGHAGTLDPDATGFCRWRWARRRRRSPIWATC
jgi:tRNA pseudouridine55 synthase